MKLWPVDFGWLMERNCNWVRSYLLHNPNVKKEDKYLCGTQAKRKSEDKKELWRKKMSNGYKKSEKTEKTYNIN